MRNSNTISKGFFSLEIVFLSIFICLFTIWIVPDTLTLKYVCLGLGGLLTFFYFVRNKSVVPNTNANRLIGLFFAWVIVHYFFIGTNSELALSEIQSIQKEAILGCLCAMGLAISLAQKKESKTLFLFSTLDWLDTPISFLFQNIYSKYFFIILTPILGGRWHENFEDLYYCQF